MTKIQVNRVLNISIPIIYLILGFMVLSRAYGNEVFLEDRIYIDEQEMTAMDDAFFIHMGDNTWIQTGAICKDKQGTYIYRSAIVCSENQRNVTDYEKTWKCPYCYRYYPVGKPCDNKDCPSRYR